MIRATLFLCCFGVLSACGADGAPKPPAKSGLSISGQIKTGVSGSL